MLASELIPATATPRWSSSLCIFSLATDVSSSLLKIFFSAASTTPSSVRTPTAAPACEMASMAYSTYGS